MQLNICQNLFTVLFKVLEGMEAHLMFEPSVSKGMKQCPVSNQQQSSMIHQHWRLYLYFFLKSTSHEIYFLLCNYFATRYCFFNRCHVNTSLWMQWKNGSFVSKIFWNSSWLYGEKKNQLTFKRLLAFLYCTKAVVFKIVSTEFD